MTSNMVEICDLFTYIHKILIETGIIRAMVRHLTESRSFNRMMRMSQYAA